MPNPAYLTENNPFLIWKAICEQLNMKLPHQNFLTWFNPVEPVSYSQDGLNLRVPSEFYSNWIVSHYSSIMREAVQDALGQEIKINFIPDIAGKKKSQQSKEILSSKPPKTKRIQYKEIHSQLIQKYQFSNFIEGDCNRFARAAAIAISKDPINSPFNPLMIYGRSGLGKTHLIHAIGNAILANNSDKRVLYVSSEKFTSDFVKAIKFGKNDSFNRLYRSVDVLLLDDVQFFMTKEKTQEEFFHTFNSLHQDGKQLVFSSDRPPRELTGFDERLVSRLQWGLVSELHIPEFETRLAILKDLSEINDINISEEIIQFLAQNITDNVRTLQGALIHLMAQSSLLGESLTLELARITAMKFINRPIFKLSIDRIQEIVSNEFEIPSDLLRSKTRKREIVEARQVAMYLCTEFTTLTLKAIGLQFGGRDHATVIHSRESICEKLKVNDKLEELMNRLRRKIELASL